MYPHPSITISLIIAAWTYSTGICVYCLGRNRSWLRISTVFLLFFKVCLALTVDVTKRKTMLEFICDSESVGLDIYRFHWNVTSYFYRIGKKRLQIADYLLVCKCSRPLTVALMLLLIQERAGPELDIITYRSKSLLLSSLLYLIRHRHTMAALLLSSSFSETSLWYILDPGCLRPLHTSLPPPCFPPRANESVVLTVQG